MPLLEPRFISLAQLLNQEMQPSFRVVTTLGRELVDAFAVLHSAGLCYRDISFGNLRVDPGACEVAIIDVDQRRRRWRPGAGQGHRAVHGARRSCATRRCPSTVTDLHSLAVLLFYLLMHGHPLLGQRADASYHWEVSVRVGDRAARAATSATRRCSSSTRTTRRTGRCPASR